MTGERHLEQLLNKMSPTLLEDEYVFCTFGDSSYGDHADADPIASFQEDEGLTLVVPRARAERAGWGYDGVFGCITLGVHSSLDAVGLTAAVTGVLADNGIAANVIAGYFHDHVFIPAGSAEQAIGLLKQVTA